MSGSGAVRTQFGVPIGTKHMYECSKHEVPAEQQVAQVAQVTEGAEVVDVVNVVDAASSMLSPPSPYFRERHNRDSRSSL